MLEVSQISGVWIWLYFILLYNYNGKGGGFTQQCMKPVLQAVRPENEDVGRDDLICLCPMEAFLQVWPTRI